MLLNQSIYIYEYKYKELDLFRSTRYSHKEIKVEDYKLIDSFMCELAKIKAQNIRGVDYLNYETKYENEIYYSIAPSYWDSNGNQILLHDFDKMIFSEMRLNSKGELVLVNHRTGFKFPLLFYNTELYRVKLSLELSNQIIDLFE